MPNLPAVIEGWPKTEPYDPAERRELVAQLKLHGYSNRQIAKVTGVSHVTIGNDLKKIRAEWKQNMALSYDQHVATEIAAYDDMEKAISDEARAGNKEAIALRLRIRERRARLLGLDSPVKHEIQVVSIDALDQEIARLESLLGPIEETTDDEVYEAEVVDD